MATIKQRITVNLPDDTAAAIRRLAAASEQSASAVIAGILTECREPLENVASILERAKSVQGALPQGAKEAVQMAADRLDGLESETRGMLEAMARQMSLIPSQGFGGDDAKDLGEQPAQPMAEASANPPTLTGGSTYAVDTPQKPSKPLASPKKRGGQGEGVH